MAETEIIFTQIALQKHQNWWVRWDCEKKYKERVHRSHRVSKKKKKKFILEGSLNKTYFEENGFYLPQRPSSYPRILSILYWMKQMHPKRTALSPTDERNWWAKKQNNLHGRVTEKKSENYSPGYNYQHSKNQSFIYNSWKCWQLSYWKKEVTSVDKWKPNLEKEFDEDIFLSSNKYSVFIYEQNIAPKKTKVIFFRGKILKIWISPPRIFVMWTHVT